MSTILRNKWRLLAGVLLTLSVIVSSLGFGQATVQAADSTTKTLTVDLSGTWLAGINVELWSSEGATKLWTQYNQQGAVRTYNVAPSIYDVKLVQGPKVLVIDNLDCNNDCNAGDVTSVLTVDLSGTWLAGINVELYKNDDGLIWTAYNQHGASHVYNVLKNTYDLKLRQGPKVLDVANINCTDEACTAGDVIETLTVDLSGSWLANINVELYVDDDGIIWTAYNQQGGVRTYNVLPNTYDLKLRQGPKVLGVPNINCKGGGCTAGDVIAQLAINLTGLGVLNTELHLNDGLAGSTGSLIWTAYNQSGTPVYNVLKNHYDVLLRQGSTIYSWDAVDCTNNTCTINLGNEPPVSDAGGPYSGTEGATIALNGASASDLDDDSLTYSWSVDSALCSFDNTSFLNPNLTCSDDGDFTATLIASDGVNPAVSNNATVDINNVAPTIALSGTDFVSEGSPYSLTLGLITDPGADTVSGYKINWGDSSSDDVAGIPSGVKTHTYPDGLNNYTITVDLTDEDGIFTSAGTKALQITNVEPAIALSGTDFINEDSVSEGSPYSLTLGLINDPGMDSVISYQINWGDPFFDIFLGSPTGEVKTHNYADGPNNYTITIDLTDEDGTFASAGSKAVTVNNVTPTIALSGDASVNEGSVYSLNLGAITDPGVDTASDYKINWGDLLFDVFAGVPTGLVKTHTYADGPNNYTIMVDLIDEDGTFTGASSKAVAANNVAPANVNATATPGTINENDSTTLSGSFTDPGTLDTHTVVIAWGDGSTDTTLNLAANVLTFSTSHQYLDDNPTETPSDINSISVTVTDRDGGFTEYTTTVTVNNVAPMLGAISVDHVLVPVNTPINAIAYFTDPGVLDTHTAVWDWEDGTSPGTVTESGGSGSVSDNHTYTTPGVYELTLTVKDDDGGQDSSIYQFVVVYDPSGGFVTGGGWINSAVNSNYLYMHVGGKATFGFVAKYKKGATVPDGNTEFQFKAGNLNFKSTSYDWLIVTGSNYAKFKGTGTINGQGDYKFQIWAGDGTGLNGADTFRIKIWYEDGGSEVVVYDNGMDQAIGGGSIVVHK